MCEMSLITNYFERYTATRLTMETRTPWGFYS